MSVYVMHQVQSLHFILDGLSSTEKRPPLIRRYLKQIS